MDITQKEQISLIQESVRTGLGVGWWIVFRMFKSVLPLLLRGNAFIILRFETGLGNGHHHIFAQIAAKSPDANLSKFIIW